MTVTYVTGRIVDMIRFLLCLFQACYLTRIVYIKLVVRHECQMVPQFTLKIGYVTQRGEHTAHYVYDGVGATLTLSAVRNRHCILNHLLYGAAVLGHRHFLSLGIIVHQTSFLGLTAMKSFR